MPSAHDRLPLAAVDHRGAHSPGEGEGRRLVRHPCRRGPLRARPRRGLTDNKDLPMTKTALVTGGARGIGRACALALADSGFDITLVDLLEKEMVATARDIEARGRRTLTFQADVSDFARAHAIVEQISAKWGQLDVLLNNAGAPNPKPILDITEAEFDRTIAVNLKSCFNFIHACAPIMLKQDTGGRIISISSINALSGGVTSAVSKHA